MPPFPPPPPTVTYATPPCASLPHCLCGLIALLRSRTTPAAELLQFHKGKEKRKIHVFIRSCLSNHLCVISLFHGFSCKTRTPATFYHPWKGRGEPWHPRSGPTGSVRVCGCRIDFGAPADVGAGVTQLWRGLS